MQLEMLRCPSCGGEGKLSRNEQGSFVLWHCAYCGAEFTEEGAEREYARLENTIKASLGSVVDDALLRERKEKYYNLRAMLWNKVTAKYIDSEPIVNICREILAIAPRDFLAEFFEYANVEDERDVAEYINKINVEENSLLIDVVLDFIIKSLRAEYITPTAALLERCSKVFTPEKKQRYLTKFEDEAAKVQEGIYEITIPRQVFLAYSSKDMPEVLKLLDFIESSGLSCFAAFRNLQHGRDAVANYEKALYEAIDNSTIFLFVSSENSRNFSCDAYSKEIMYIRKSEMERHPQYRTYEQIPDKYKKLRIEYRLDNKPTPIVDRALKSFFSGLTYAEDYDQLIDRLGECMDMATAPYIDEDEIKRREQEEQLRKERERLEAEKQAWQQQQAKETTESKAEEARKPEASSTDGTQYVDSCVIKGNTLMKFVDHEGNVEHCVIPSYIEEIAANAFERCTTLTGVTIPAGVKKIGNAAFSGCSALTEIELPESLAELGPGVFQWCSALRRVDISKGVTKISNNAFSNCYKLKHIEVHPDNPAYKSIDGCLYTKNGESLLLYKVGSMDAVAKVSAGTLKVAYPAFYHASEVSEVSLPAGLKAIEPLSFAYAKRLTKINIPGTVWTIGKKAFLACSGLKEITVPESVVDLQEGAFDGCSCKLRFVRLEPVDTWDPKWKLGFNGEIVWGAALDSEQPAASAEPDKKGGSFINWGTRGNRPHISPADTITQVKKAYENGVYEGGMSQGKFYGDGRFTDKQGNVFSGYFINGKLTKGLVLYKNGWSYDGDLLDFRRHGQGKLLMTNNHLYVGEFVNDEFVKGTLDCGNGISYDGEFKNWIINGKGGYGSKDGTYIKGNFVDGLFNGECTIYYKDGGMYVGQFVKSVKHGPGKFTNADGIVIESTYVNGERMPHCKVTTVNGEIMEGDFIDNKPHGKILTTLTDGSQEIRVYKNGVLKSRKKKR